MKAILFALSASLVSTAAFAEDSLFVKYEKLATGLATRVVSDDAKQNIVTLAVRNTRLQDMGEEIMDLYGVKYPECALQYADFKSKISTLPDLTAEDIHAKYHDAEDLPSAPSHCYFGRSLVIHPAMSAVRLADGDLSADDVEAVKEESIEVSFHVKTVAKRLAQ
jgi:hypothetical protein